MAKKRKSKRSYKRKKPLRGQKTLQTRRMIRAGLVFLVLLAVVLVIIKKVKPSLLSIGYFEQTGVQVDASEPEIDVELLTVNPYSRPGIKTDKIKGIVVHYTANPGATAMDNRNYFENLKNTHKTKTSSNFIVGLDGEIVQCIPTWEVAYASNNRNHDTVSIECCHPDKSGKFTDETYASVVQLSAWLCLKFDLDEKDVIRHHDVTGKNCPKYFVENEEAWEQFRMDIKHAMERSK